MENTNENPNPVPSRESVVELKKDGTVSRMRSHKGNVPQLPQTKLCPFCPAKFTRTTHLNRHLRNHTNERMYRCEACGSQFTRSDLLARHKKSCGESPSNFTSRSRRRSCQTCASLKVKCDLRQPCGKCKARSRECIYPVENPDDYLPSSSRVGSMGIANIDGSAGFIPSQASLPGNSHMAAFPELSLIEESSNAFAPPLSEANLSSFLGLQDSAGIRSSAMSLPTLNDGESTAHTAPSFFGFDNRAFTSFVPSDIAAPSNAPGLGSFSNNMFEPFFQNVFHPASPSGIQSNSIAGPGTSDKILSPNTTTGEQTMQTDAPSLQSLFAGIDGLHGFDANGSVAATSQPRTSADQDLLVDMMAANYQEPILPALTPEQVMSMHPEITNTNPGTAHSTYTQDELLSVLQPPRPFPTDQAIPNPTDSELEHYMHIFLKSFLPQIPILHIPTLRFELKPPIFIQTIQACGALFAKTPVADAFVERTLGTLRERLVMEFAKPSDNPKHQMYIIMTLVLLQTIGLFHQSPQQRASSNLYHGMLVLMIRQNRVLERSGVWKTPTFPIPDPDALDAAWRDWTIHEGIKRCMFIAYTHDQSHPIFFSLPASFAPNEYAIRLPCEEALWNAPDAFAWSQTLLAESPYGTISQRLLGVPMLHGMAALGLEGGQMESADPFKDVGAIPPFGHWILMHALLGELFRRCHAADSPAHKQSGQEEEVDPNVFAVQLYLHKWLKLWLLNPDAPLAAAPNGHVDGGTKPVAYMNDPLPFYWLGQLLLLAFQEGLPPFALASPPYPDNHPSPQSRNSSSDSPPTSTSSASSPFSPFDSAPSVSSTSSHSHMSMSPPSQYPGKSVEIHPSLIAPEQSAAPATLYYASPTFVPPEGPKRRQQTDAASAQFSLIKNWLQHIRSFLRRSEGSPTVVWDELMRIRLSSWYADTSTKECRRLRQQTNGASSLAEDDAEAHGLLGLIEDLRL